MTKKNQKGGPNATKEGAVVMPLKTDKEPVFMAEEVDTLAAVKKAVKDDVKTELRQLVGTALKKAEEKLQQFITDGKIGSFRVIQQGQLFTGEYEADRVQIFVADPDGDNEIKEIEVG